ncbi:MAG: LCP family protein [bacterium]
MTKRKMFIVIGVVFSLVLVIVLGGWLFLFYKSGGNIEDLFIHPSHIVTFTQKMFYGPPAFNIVLLGKDYDYDNTGRRLETGRTDTIIVFHIDCNAKRIVGISIPRDTLVDIPNYGENKINAAYHIGGVPLALDIIKTLLGVDINYYAVIDPESFRRIVDIIGGVDIYVEKDMKYRDSWAKLNINLKKGQQKLNGEEAEGYIRFRHDAMGDLGRIERQQKFFYALVGEVLKPNNIIKLPTIVQEASKYIQTNIPPAEIVLVGIFIAREKGEIEIKTTTLPGNLSRGYWIPNKEEITKFVNQLFNTEESSGTAQARILLP